MADLLDPSELILTDDNNKERKFILSKFPAVQGREIIAKYPTSNLPKIGDYAASEEVMLKLMAFVETEKDGHRIRLATRALIDNHVPSWEMLAQIEMAMMEKNCSFFRNATLADSLASVAQNALQKISAMLTGLSEQSSTQEKPASTTSGRSIQ